MSQILFTGITLNELAERIGQVIDSKIRDFAPYQKTEKQSDYITRAEVARLLKISLPTLNEWTKLGWLQSYKIGNRVLYKREEVESSLHEVSFRKYKKGGINHGS
jgi:excisionase family DNA binding protein